MLSVKVGQFGSASDCESFYGVRSSASSSRANGSAASTGPTRTEAMNITSSEFINAGNKVATLISHVFGIGELWKYNSQMEKEWERWPRI